jgi:hypothetical protein
MELDQCLLSATGSSSENIHGIEYEKLASYQFAPKPLIVAPLQHGV